MPEAASKRLAQASKDLNVRMQTLVDFLASKGHFIENRPITKLTSEQIAILDFKFDKENTSHVEAPPVNTKQAVTFPKLEYIRRTKGKPNTFYKYFNTSSYHLDGLEKGYIFLSPPNSFNDPFDCSTSLIDFSTRSKGFNSEAVRRFKEHLGNIGICCFSRINDSILMWSHYADSHRGFCVEFSMDPNEPADIHPLDVCYQEDFVKLNFHRDPDNSIVNMIYTKSIHWQYEEELRILDNNLTDIEKRKKYFNSKKIKSIFLGINCEEEVISRVKQLVKQKYTRAKLYQACRDIDSFSISFKKVIL